MTVPPINLKKLHQDFAQLERQGVRYHLGSKAQELSLPLTAIRYLDCSGYIRYALYRATGGALIIPDGSQMQREWAEKAGLHKLAQYSDVETYGADNRLFIAFIKPGENGSGSIGHVWGISGKPAETLEAHSSGVTPRPWNTGILRREVYSVYEMPVK